jgi:hypothetical protein
MTGRTKATRSVLETNVGWFPTKLEKKPVETDWNPLEDPWQNGTMLSELTAKLLINEKNLVKEVTSFYFTCSFIILHFRSSTMMITDD